MHAKGKWDFQDLGLNIFAFAISQVAVAPHLNQSSLIVDWIDTTKFQKKNIKIK